MNDRSSALRLIAIVLMAYGIYITSHVVAMLPGPSSVLLLVGFVLQAVCALVAAVGVWRDERWASGVVLLLGVSIAATWLAEAFVIGIVPYLHALIVALFAIVIAVVLGRYIDRRGGLRIA